MDTATTGHTPETTPLRPEVALPLLRGHTWHPGTVGVMICHLMDWLRDTDQLDEIDELRGIEVLSPHSADGTTLGSLTEGERRAAE